MMTGSLLLMVATSPELALKVLPLLLATAALIAFFIIRTEPLYRSVQTKLDALNNVLHENIAGARLVKALSRASFEQARFDSSNTDMTERSIHVMRLMAAMTPALTLCVNVGLVVVIWAGGLQAIEGSLSLGQIVAFSNYMLSTMTPLIMMTMLSNTWAAGLASAKRIHEVLITQPQIQDCPSAVALLEGSQPQVRLENVSFTYPGVGNEPVLTNVDLEVPAGTTLAILGATGSGKTTLVSLIPRFYDPTLGRVCFGGHDVKQVTQDSLLARIAVVPQESVLFSGTVRDNIRYGRPDAAAQEVEAAATAAQAHDFIELLPRGYDTLVQPRGANFSGGQKQRIAIARALLMRPDLLILDDSTSAVDAETELKIQAALETRQHARTMVLVAQRISTVLKADQIAVLERGRIVARGKHRELLSSSAVYREIFESQLGGASARAVVGGNNEVGA
jgi:ATP-binding cassette subfamily B multidrug efflux pump